MRPGVDLAADLPAVLGVILRAGHERPIRPVAITLHTAGFRDLFCGATRWWM